MKLALWVLFALAILIVAYLAVGLFVAMRLSAPSRQPQEQNPADVGLGYREVSLRSTDGLRLAAWWVPGDGPGRAVVLVPGLGGDKSDRHVLETAAVYARAGYGVLMIDLRAQGRSEGERITMGYQEVRDVQGALSWLEERGFSPGEIVLHKLFLGIDTRAVRPAQNAGELCEEGTPLLIIHSKDDQTVPFEHAGRLEEACPDATLWAIAGYEHVGAYAHPEYRQRLLGFLKTEAFAEEA